MKGNINLIYKYQNKRIILVSKQNKVFLLKEGEHEIYRDKRYDGKICGIVPLTETVVVTSRGNSKNKTRTKI
jgi:thiamine pyrophosphokinase